MNEQVHSIAFDSPLGLFLAQATDEGVVALRPAATPGERSSVDRHPILDRLRAGLARYFAGSDAAFDVPLTPRGTPFEEAVWSELARVPPGETISYGSLARRVGRPSAARAVGAANGKNPIAILIPCHRVIGSDGALTGYAWGLERKAWLLAHEAGLRARDPMSA